MRWFVSIANRQRAGEFEFEAGERVVIPSSESHFECLCELTSLSELFICVC